MRFPLGILWKDRDANTKEEERSQQIPRGCDPGSRAALWRPGIPYVGRRGAIHNEIQGEKAIFQQGDPADAVFYIQEGEVKLTVISKQGKEAVVAMLEPIQKVVESEESTVIHCRAPESKQGSARCGRLNIAAHRIGAACVIPAI
jgi:CRP-like cAMP-binding protein